jgi:hypothetical protein
VGDDERTLGQLRERRQPGRSIFWETYREAYREMPNPGGGENDYEIARSRAPDPVVGGAFDEVTTFETSAGADESDEVWCVDRAPADRLMVGRPKAGLLAIIDVAMPVQLRYVTTSCHEGVAFEHPHWTVCITISKLMPLGTRIWPG